MIHESPWVVMGGDQGVLIEGGEQSWYRFAPGRGKQQLGPLRLEGLEDVRR